MGPLHTLPADVSAWKVAGGRVQHKDDLILRIQWLWPKDSRENIVGRGLVLCLGLLFSHSVVSTSLRPCGPQHARLPCSSPSPGVCSYAYPLSRWCHPTILSSVAPFSCPQSFLAWRSLPMSRLNLYAMSVKYVYFNVCVSEITSSDCNMRTRQQIFVPIFLQLWVRLACVVIINEAQGPLRQRVTGSQGSQPSQWIMQYHEWWCSQHWLYGIRRHRFEVRLQSATVLSHHSIATSCSQLERWD